MCKYSKTLVCEQDSFRKHACHPKRACIKATFENHRLICDHATFGVTYDSCRKTSLVCQVKIYWKRLLVLRNIRTSSSRSKVLLYWFSLLLYFPPRPSVRLGCHNTVPLIFSPFWRPEVRDQGVRTVGFS